MPFNVGDVVRLSDGDEMVVFRLYPKGAEVFLNIAGKIYVQLFSYDLLQRV